jgi:hypothetical protein
VGELLRELPLFNQPRRQESRAGAGARALAAANAPPPPDGLTWTAEDSARLAADVEKLKKKQAREHAAKRLPTGLVAEELCSKHVHAVEADFAPVLEELRGVAERHRAELRQWYELDGVTPTLGALMALLRFFQGLAPNIYQPGDRRRLNGLGLQVPQRFLADVFERHRSTICDAFNLGERMGFLLRHSPTRRVDLITKHRPPGERLEHVTTRDGETRTHVNVHGVVYLTPKGAAWLDRRGTTRRELGELKGRLRGTRGRVLVGIQAELLRLLKTVRLAVAKRLTRLPTHPTPEAVTPHERMLSVVAVPVENGPAPPVEAVRPEAARVGAGSTTPQAGARGTSSAATPLPVRPVRFGRGAAGWRSATASPMEGPAADARPGAPAAGNATHDGLSGGSAPRAPGATPRGEFYGPPRKPGSYLDAETERCWQNHIVIEGGPMREELRPVLGVGGEWTGDFRRVRAPGRLKVWSPALVAAEAYLLEWRALRRDPANRAAFEDCFNWYLGPRLRRRFIAFEKARREAGGAAECPVPGCGCLAKLRALGLHWAPEKPGRKR